MSRLTISPVEIRLTQIPPSDFGEDSTIFGCNPAVTLPGSEMDRAGIGQSNLKNLLPCYGGCSEINSHIARACSKSPSYYLKCQTRRRQWKDQ